MVLRAGLIGLGVMGRHHARVLSSLTEVELVGIADPAYAGLTMVGHSVVASADMIVELEPDYCVVAAPTYLHGELGRLLASEGIHALIEKPLAESSPAARELANNFEGKGLVAAVGHIERYNPAVIEARKRIQSGQLGRILQVATRRQGPYPGRIGDVGVVTDSATHDIDLTSWITGQTYSRIGAQTFFGAGREHEDMVVASGLLSQGSIVSHVVNWLSPFKERRVVVSGEEGAFVIDTLSADLTFYENGTQETEWSELASFRGVKEGNMIRYSVAKPEPLRVQHESFRDAVLGKATELVTLGEGLQAVLVAEAMLLSATTGTTISLEQLSQQ